MTKKNMRVIAKHSFGVPFPGQPKRKVGSVPTRVDKSPYWLRYLDMGLIIEVEGSPQPAATMPMMASKGEE